MRFATESVAKAYQDRRSRSMVSYQLQAAALTDAQQLEGGNAKVMELAFSPDGKRLSAARGDSTARVWETATGRPIGEPMKRPAAITSIDFSADGRYLAIADENKQAVLMDQTAGAR